MVPSMAPEYPAYEPLTTRRSLLSSISISEQHGGGDLVTWQYRVVLTTGTNL